MVDFTLPYTYCHYYYYFQFFFYQPILLEVIPDQVVSQKGLP